MHAAKSDIISQLQTDLLKLQGYKQTVRNTALDTGLGEIINAFPNATFPIGCVHEFLSATKEDKASTTGFIAGLLRALTDNNGAALWVSSSRTLFPPALKNFGINPERVVFVDVTKEQDILWVMDEALKCGALHAVVAEIRELSFMNSRRLQLAVEQSQVTGFVLRTDLHKISTTACVSRWRITSLPGEPLEDLPGVSFPKWNVELLRIRNGKPGSWNVTWKTSRFHVEPVVHRTHQPFIQQAG